MKVGSLSELKKVKQTLDAQAQRAAAQEALQAQALAARELAARQTAKQHSLFRAAVGSVRRIPESTQADLRPTPPSPVPRQQERDAQAALAEALSDSVDISTLLETDESLSFRRPGVGPDVTQKLRRGKWTIQRQIDLHGLRSDAAREALTGFIRDAHKHGIRCVRVVHGKGLGSPGKTPVLKDKVLRWLVQKSEVVAFVQAPPAQGGAGALLVLLQPVRV